MRKLALLSALLAAACVGGVAAADPNGLTGGSGTVFVTERALGSVGAYDGATGALLWSRPVGSSPIGVTQPRGTEFVYTSDEGSNRMTVRDRRTGDLVTTIPTGPLPHHLMASESGELIYVAQFGSNTIGVIDTSSNTHVADYVANPDLTARTHAVFITRSGNDLYATDTRIDRTLQGDVAHLDGRTGEWLCNTMVGADPSEILITPNGRTGFVSVRRENKIKELDTSSDCPVLTGREAVIGTMPDTLQLTNDGKTLVVTLRGTPAQISLLDTETFAVRIVTIPGHAVTGHHWLSANSKYTFVAVETPAGLAVVDNDSGETVADYPYPTGSRAHGVFYEPEVLR
jgi:DNA-binding beta-propeller fold protein YncE